MQIYEYKKNMNAINERKLLIETWAKSPIKPSDPSHSKALANVASAEQKWTQLSRWSILAYKFQNFLTSHPTSGLADCNDYYNEAFS